ncbi:LLM class flavin-dependent oxidoreductase [Hyalangium rubrum]|uniref:LLM class flavin-dependent oxidoreductase n=1 Tax=Hyalangium rubrum TaxID=3103134 RepID=A0ABU5HD60_9BACT|nr:LLM class flavin-dependent oxidoreductase [Hyalangium sp. s54d21]MDY7231067.1 LLM class flavin-dependent oxidoreductase [Hyalangium sp. s54d21]
MKIDIFCEMMKPKMFFGEGQEHALILETLEQARLADELGYGCWWQVEHHGAPHFSYSSAPEMMLTAIARSTRRMRVGHSAVLAPIKVNHPMRIAERAAFLDHLSEGRLELGLARSTLPEWRVFNVEPDDVRRQLQQAFEMIPKMWTQERFSWSSPDFTLKDVAVVPKPFQKPHPPLWQAVGTPSGFEQAGRNGVGVLLTTVSTPIAAVEEMLEVYRREIKRCTPVGQTVNDQVALFTFVHCAETEREAIEHGAAAAAAWYINTAFTFFEAREHMMRTIDEMTAAAERDPTSPLAAYAKLTAEKASAPKSPTTALLDRLVAGEQVSNEEVYEILNADAAVIIGDVASCRKKMQRYKDIGIDRLMCFQQVGHLPHEHIMNSIRLVGEHLIPMFDPK